MGSSYTKSNCGDNNCNICRKSERSFCVECKNGKVPHNGICKASCPENTYYDYYDDKYKMCFNCFGNCKTCDGNGNSDNMRCSTCPENMIKYNQNCYEIKDNDSKTFQKNNNQVSSCYQLGHKYIIENTKECIDRPNGYYVSNTITGLLSPCYPNCETCESEEVITDEKLINMKCTTCKPLLISNDDNQMEKLSFIFELEKISQTPKMIKVEENCFPPLIIQQNKIIFNISEIYPEEQNGTCYFFNKTIYSGNYECIERPDNTYYVINDTENTGVIKDCSKACKSCTIGKTSESTNCLECADGYYHFPSDTVPYNCGKGETLMSMCYYACSSCLDYPEKNEAGDIINQNCLECIDNYHMMDGTNNCYDDSITEKGYYLSYYDYMYHLCDIECKTCINKNNCFECNTESGYERDQDGIKCIKKPIDKTSSKEFKNQILRNVTSFVNSSTLINGSDFIAVVLSSDEMDPKEQIKKGISAIDLGDCIEQLKEYYNISKNESLIILNMESKRNESKTNTENNNNAFDIGKSSQIEIYDKSGRKLELSVCKEDIKILKYIGDLKEELNIDTAMNFAESGVDIFNSKDGFFNNLCHEYDNIDGKDIVIGDRRNDLYKNVSFCEQGCTYNGMNYELMIANCICDTSIMQNENNTENNGNENEGFNSLSKSILASLIDCNFDVFNCYNLVFNIKFLKNNIGFYCMIIMFIIQLICLFIYIVKKLKSLKNFMLTFKSKNLKDLKASNLSKNSNNGSISKLIGNSTKNNSIKSKFNNGKKNKQKENMMEDETNNEVNSKRKFMFMDDENILKNMLSNNNINKTREIKRTNLINDIQPPLLRIFENTPIDLSSSKKGKMNLQKQTKYIKSEYIDNVNNDKFYNIKKNNQNKLEKNAKYTITGYKKDIINGKGKKIVKNKINNLETIEEKGNMKFNKKKYLYQTDEDIQDMDYEEAIIYDKRTFLKIYWSFLVDSQIILGTFFTDNYLNLFVIKFSFLIFTFQISFFLNAFFYTDEYISDAYHNDGVLDFVTGLPKSIYSFIATLITTNLLRMLSNSKSELKKIIRNKGNNKDYIHLIDIKLRKLRIKLIIYFIFIFSLGLLFLYYVSSFCSVYRNSQKYWFIGCLESFGIDSAVAIAICIFLAIFRYIAIHKKIKCFYCLANFISTFL